MQALPTQRSNPSTLAPDSNFPHQPLNVPPLPAAVRAHFHTRDGGGRVVVIEELAAGASYRLQQGGGLVERVSDSLFCVVSTRELMRRDDGGHTTRLPGPTRGAA